MNMQLNKYKITTPKLGGFMMVTYHENIFKSVVNEFKPPLTERQLNAILNCIPNDPAMIEKFFNQANLGQVVIEHIKSIGAEPEQEAKDFPVNKKIAVWCELYAAIVKDKEGNPVKYKTGAAESGKLKALAVGPDELTELVEVYLKSNEWYLTPKSISQFIKKYNEVRALAYAKPKAKQYPLPYDEAYYNRLDFMGKREYHEYLRANNYKFEANPGRGGKWIKQNTINH